MSAPTASPTAEESGNRTKGSTTTKLYVFGASGVAPAYRRAMLDEIGLLDADYGSYCEDVDLSWRAQLAGYRCVYAPDSVLYHKVSATGKGTLRSFYVARNTIWMLAKNLPRGHMAPPPARDRGRPVAAVRRCTARLAGSGSARDHARPIGRPLGAAQSPAQTFGDPSTTPC